MQKSKITIYHSPDADDAFMFHGLVSGAVSDDLIDFDHQLCDIESLNQRTLKGELDVTAISVHAYAFLKEPYVILSCGASMGGADYGPRLIANSGIKLDQIKRIAIPGQFTSAALALKLWLNEKNLSPELVPIHFEAVEQNIKNGEVDAGVIIHEGQLTFSTHGFTCLLDLGEWWWKKHSLPLPLGVNVARASLGEDTIARVSRALKSSIEYSLANRKKALEYALSYGRGLDISDADTFVGMYVNQITCDMGEDGRKSVKLFLNEAAGIGVIPCVDLRFA